MAERLVAGGEALARVADGASCWSAGRCPGERVRGRLGARRPGAPSGARRSRCSRRRRTGSTGHCAHVAEGCGGCDWQLLDPVTRSAPRPSWSPTRSAGWAASRTRRCGPAPRSGTGAFRTTLRVAVVGRPGRVARPWPEPRRRSRSTTAWWPTRCSTSWCSRAASARRARSPCGSAPRTGERLALVYPDRGRGRAARRRDRGRRRRARPPAAGPGSTRRSPAAAGASRPSRSSRPAPTAPRRSVERGAPTAADVLGAPASAGPTAHAGRRLCGVGLFCGALLDRTGTGRPAGWRAVAVERSRSSVADARHNLADLDARVVGRRWSGFRAPRADLVVADPSRAGLGRKRACTCCRRPAAARLVLVSCDPASAGRDAALLEASRLPLRRGRGRRPVPAHPPRRGRQPLRPGARLTVMMCVGAPARV